jgi:hypothetical protein
VGIAVLSGLISGSIEFLAGRHSAENPEKSIDRSSFYVVSDVSKLELA